MIYVFTSAARNYLPKTALLAESLKRFHPEFRRVLALSDTWPEEEPADELWDEILPADKLGIPNFRRWAFCHSIVELSTAIKPFALRQLLERDDCDGVIYFDPDMVLFSRLDDICSAMTGTDLLLTPHQLAPEQSHDAIIDNEISSLRHGVFNLGFFAVRNSEQGQEVARWWGERTYGYCRDDIPNGLFTDQKWMDLAPAFFAGTGVLRSPRFNVAPWNLTTRSLSGTRADGYLVGEDPLGFYHFTGFDSGAHQLMAKKYAGDNPAVSEIVSWYVSQMRELGKDPRCRLSWAYGQFADGTKIEAGHRIIYRSRHDLQRSFPDPFATSGRDGYLGWCRGRGRLQYPKMLPRMNPDADWSSLTTPPRPALMDADGLGSPPSVSTHLKTALKDGEHRRLLFAQAMALIRARGLRALLGRLISRW